MRGQLFSGSFPGLPRTCLTWCLTRPLQATTLAPTAAATGHEAAPATATVVAASASADHEAATEGVAPAIETVISTPTTPFKAAHIRSKCAYPECDKDVYTTRKTSQGTAKATDNGRILIRDLERLKLETPTATEKAVNQMQSYTVCKVHSSGLPHVRMKNPCCSCLVSLNQGDAKSKFNRKTCGECSSEAARLMTTKDPLSVITKVVGHPLSGAVAGLSTTEAVLEQGCLYLVTESPAAWAAGLLVPASRELDLPLYNRMIKAMTDAKAGGRKTWGFIWYLSDDTAGAAQAALLALRRWLLMAHTEVARAKEINVIVMGADERAPAQDWATPGAKVILRNEWAFEKCEERERRIQGNKLRMHGHEVLHGNEPEFAATRLAAMSVPVTATHVWKYMLDPREGAWATRCQHLFAGLDVSVILPE